MPRFCNQGREGLDDLCPPLRRERLSHGKRNEFLLERDFRISKAKRVSSAETGVWGEIWKPCTVCMTHEASPRHNLRSANKGVFAPNRGE